MKKGISVLIVLCLCLVAQAKDRDLTFWGLTERNVDNESSYIGRIGYELDDFLLKEPNNIIEPFIGTQWEPTQNTEAGVLNPPDTLLVGCLYHIGNLLDPNNPLPWISDTLLIVLSEDDKATPYIGGQGSWNFVDDDGAFYGGIVGLLVQPKQTNEKIVCNYVFELDYDNFFHDLGTIKDDDEFTFYIGLRAKF
jgi:hypothetical protein